MRIWCVTKSYRRFFQDYKMRKINFTKMVASGNDFVVIESSPRSPVPGPRFLAKEICDRKFGIGADGLLVLEKSKVADIKMRIFNADGSEAQMCGNGARCVALYTSHKVTRSGGHKLNIETKAGIIGAEINQDKIKIKLTDPKHIKLGIPIKINNRILMGNFINTGVPHTVVFVEGLKEIDVFNLGRQIRHHQRFKPAGTNVNFIEILTDNSFKIRTYERGVEDETLACGTGSVASAIIAAGVLGYRGGGAQNISAHTQSGEILEVYFNSNHNIISDVWLAGKAKMVYKGEIYV